MAVDIAVYDLDQPRHFGRHDPAVGPLASGSVPTKQIMADVAAGKVVLAAQPRFEAARLVDL